MHISGLHDVRLIEKGIESYFYSMQDLETAKYFSFWKSCLAVQHGRANFAVAAALRRPQQNADYPTQGEKQY